MRRHPSGWLKTPAWNPRGACNQGKEVLKFEYFSSGALRALCYIGARSQPALHVARCHAVRIPQARTFVFWKRQKGKIFNFSFLVFRG